MTRALKAAVGIGLEVNGWEDRVAFTVEAERLGVDSVWASEAWGSDAISPLAFLAARTSRVRLGTSIIQAGTRTPALVGMTAGAMSLMTGGRFVLGLGVSGPQVIEGWHGIRFERPVTRMRETVEIVRRVLAGDRVAFDGKAYTLPLPGGEGKSIRSSLGVVEPVPVFLATLAPKSLEMTGEIGDGWLASSFMPDHAEVFLGHLRTGAERAGRTLADLELHAGGTVAFGDDIDRLLEPRRPGLAFEMGAMGSREHNYYNEAYQRAGYREVALEVQRLWLDRRRDDAVALVPDEMILKTNLLGTEAMVKDRIRVYRDAGITTLSVDPVGETVAERVEALGRFMRLLGEVNAEVVVDGKR